MVCEAEAMNIIDHIRDSKASVALWEQSTDLRLLLNSLLDKNPATRLSSEEFCSHPLFGAPMTDAEKTTHPAPDFARPTNGVHEDMPIQQIVTSMFQRYDANCTGAVSLRFFIATVRILD